MKFKVKADEPHCSQDCPPADGCWRGEAVLRLLDSKLLCPQSQPKREERKKKIEMKTYLVKIMHVYEKPQENIIQIENIYFKIFLVYILIS